MSKKVVFYITGFGMFVCPGIGEVNPTDYLVQQLHKSPELFQGTNWTVNFATVSSVSAIDALQTLLNLHKQYHQKKESNEISVFLHMGVSRLAAEFTLEQYAYNETNWSNPDSKNWTAGIQEIIANSPDSFACQIPEMEKLKDMQSQEYPCCLSVDPGRYLCNYIYYNSLLLSKDDPNLYSLFLHVPLFEIKDREQQQKELAFFLKTFSEHLLARHS